MKPLSILSAILITLIILCNIAINAFANVGAITLPLEIITTVHQKIHDSKYFSGGVTDAVIADTASLDVLISVGANHAWNDIVTYLLSQEGLVFASVTGDLAD